MNNDYLIHYRTPGSKNGKRLYQYPDGRYTPLGKMHYGIGKQKNHIKRANQIKEYGPMEFGNYKNITGNPLYTGEPNVSKEFQEELAFNSQKNQFPNQMQKNEYSYKPITGQSLYSESDYKENEKRNNSNLEKQDKNGTSVTTNKQSSKEFQEELAFNSQKNQFPKNAQELSNFSKAVYSESRNIIKEFFTTSKNEYALNLANKNKKLLGNTSLSILDSFQNKQLDDACKAYVTQKENGTFGNTLNYWFQNAQYGIVKGVNNLLKNMKLDNKVNNFLSKFKK